MAGRTFVYHKLIRDGILHAMVAHGEKPQYRVLSDVEYRQELLKKLHEEVAELEGRAASKADELADIQEVLDCLAAANNITPAQLKTAQIKKRAKYGSFKERTYLDRVTLHENNPWLAHLVANPDRYPEVTT